MTEKEWENHSPPLDKYTVLRIKNAGSSDEGGSGEAKDVYDFYVNVDNFYLQCEVKPAGSNSDLLRNRFVYGNVLLGLAILHQDELDAKLKNQGDIEVEKDEEDGESEPNIEDRVESFTRATAPVLLPMIEHLSVIDADEPASADASGEST